MGGRAVVRGERRRRQGQRAAAATFAVVAIGPWIVWHHTVSAVADDFHLDVDYLSGWVPFVLIALGIAFFVPVAWSVGRDPEDRWYPRSRNAYLGWGVTLYLLGCALATQVAQLTEGLTSL